MEDSPGLLVLDWYNSLGQSINKLYSVLYTVAVILLIDFRMILRDDTQTSYKYIVQEIIPRSVIDRQCGLVMVRSAKQDDVERWITEGI